jgi:membrane protein YdbS with pleckstrin-like domain
VNDAAKPITEFQSLDPRNIQLETLTSLIAAGILGIGWLLASLIQFLFFGLGIGTTITLVAGLLLLPLLFWLSFYWPKLSYRMTSWRQDHDGLEIRRGVMWRHRISVPVARVQHADVSQGPIQRQFGLGTLTIHTAGTQNASVALDGLAHEIALELRDKIVRQRKAVDVV